MRLQTAYRDLEPTDRDLDLLLDTERDLDRELAEPDLDLAADDLEPDRDLRSSRASWALDGVGESSPSPSDSSEDEDPMRLFLDGPAPESLSPPLAILSFSSSPSLSSEELSMARETIFFFCLELKMEK